MKSRYLTCPQCGHQIPHNCAIQMGRMTAGIKTERKSESSRANMAKAREKMAGMRLQAIEAKARDRVSSTPELQEYSKVIFYAWPNIKEHWAWIANATVQDIVDWAESIRIP